MNPSAARPEGAEEMPQATRLDDVRIRDVRPLISPALLQYEHPADDAVQAFIERSRGAVADVVHGRDARLLAVVGPCSIHDADQALEYAGRLRALAGELRDLQQQLAREPQALVDAEAAVQARVVDEALPAHGGARLLEVDAHHDREVVGEAVALGLEPPGVVDRGAVVVDRARAHNHQQPVVGAAQDVVDRAASLEGRLLARLGPGQLAHDLHRREQLVALFDPYVVGAVMGHINKNATSRVAVFSDSGACSTGSHPLDRRRA